MARGTATHRQSDSICHPTRSPGKSARTLRPSVDLDARVPGRKRARSKRHGNTCPAWTSHSHLLERYFAISPSPLQRTAKHIRLDRSVSVDISAFAPQRSLLPETGETHRRAMRHCTLFSPYDRTLEFR